MWYGIDTIRLKFLKKKYEKIYGCNPDCYLGVEYDWFNYRTYVRDIKECIRRGDTEIEELYYDDDEWW